MHDETVITGLVETQRALEDLPRRLVARAFSKALEAGIDVLAAELYARTPGQSAENQHEGLEALKDAIVSEIAISEQDGVAGVGFGNLGHVAMWVEFGHRLVGHMPHKKVIGDVEPHPFMRPTFEAAAERAIEAFGDALSEELNGGW